MPDMTSGAPTYVCVDTVGTEQQQQHQQHRGTGSYLPVPTLGTVPVPSQFPFKIRCRFQSNQTDSKTVSYLERKESLSLISGSW